MRIFDLHNDVVTKSFGRAERVFQASKKSESKVILAVWTSELNNPYGYFDFASKTSDFWAIEDLGFCKISGIFKVYKPKYASLTWNYENQFAGGANSGGELKSLGVEMIRAMEESGVVLDVAHLNKKSFFSAVGVAKKPIISSHTCFDGVFKHSRNLSDEQIWAIIDSGGIVGLSFVADFMGVRRARICDIIKQIEYFAQNFPLKYLAVGTDYFGAKPSKVSTYARFEGLCNELIRLNYSKEQIDGIFFNNANNFFKTY